MKKIKDKLTLLAFAFLIISIFVSCSKSDVDNRTIIDENYLNLDYSDFGKGANIKGDQELSVNGMSDEKFKIVLKSVDRFEDNVKKEKGIYDLNSIDREKLNMSPALYDYCLNLFSICNSQSLQEMVIYGNESLPETRSAGELYAHFELCYEFCFYTCGGDVSRYASAILSFLSRVTKLDLRLSFALQFASLLINHPKVKAIKGKRISVSLKYHAYDKGTPLELMVNIVDFKQHKPSPCGCDNRPIN